MISSQMKQTYFLLIDVISMNFPILCSMLSEIDLEQMACHWAFAYFQLILATTPDPKHGKSPSIVTEDNIQLLFEIQKKVI